MLIESDDVHGPSPDESDEDPREDTDDQCETEELVDTDGEDGLVLEDGSDGSGVDSSLLPSDDHPSRPPPTLLPPLALFSPPPPLTPLLLPPTLCRDFLDGAVVHGSDAIWEEPPVPLGTRSAGDGRSPSDVDVVDGGGPPSPTAAAAAAAAALTAARRRGRLGGPRPIFARHKRHGG